MQTTNNLIVKNVGVMLVAQVITWALGFLWAIFLPGYLGDTNMGRYAIALSIWSVMSGVINTGVTTLFVKEIARSPDTALDALGTILIQRYIFFFASCGIVATYMHFMQYPPETIMLIWIVALSQPLGHTSEILRAVFQGFEIMYYMSVIDVVVKFATVGLSFLLMFLHFGVNEIAAVSVVAFVIYTVLQVIVLRQQVKLRLTWNNRLAIELLKKSAPYFFSMLVMTLYFEADKLIMSVLVEERVIGWYTVATNLSATFLFVPGILTTAIFPALSRGATEASDKGGNLLRKSLDITLLAGVPVGLGLAVVANSLIQLIYHSNFSESGPVLMIMGVTLIFTYLATLLGRYIVASDQTNKWTITMFVCTVLTFPLDFLFIPWCQRVFGNGAIGGALSFACTEFLMVVVALFLLPRGTLTWQNGLTALRILLAGTVMVMACWTVRNMFIAIPILVGMATYTSMVAILRILTPDDVDILWSGVRGIFAKVRVRLRGSDTVGVGEV